DDLNWVLRTGAVTCQAGPCPRKKSLTLFPGLQRSARNFRVSRTRSRRIKAVGVLPMAMQNTISRRGLLLKLGILFNGFVAMLLAVPIVRFFFSSVTRGRAEGYLSWVSLGSVDQFPEGETRLATFRNPYVTPTDGKTVDTACWVRRIEGDHFQVFAINCAH